MVFYRRRRPVLGLKLELHPNSERYWHILYALWQQESFSPILDRIQTVECISCQSKDIGYEGSDRILLHL